MSSLCRCLSGLAFFLTGIFGVDILDTAGHVYVLVVLTARSSTVAGFLQSYTWSHSLCNWDNTFHKALLLPIDQHHQLSLPQTYL
ncbi:hypothetical protein GDO81_013304 [Engystomops pustulosus]|uniref:Secreted protein n=1 Tax=Engystomops pustulosus TaxID=76066 RepID=A0AAV7B3Q1_ENGPU|nr:hypothetical protein GDO81_013304 [Engystomops pustulosus]